MAVKELERKGALAKADAPGAFAASKSRSESLYHMQSAVLEEQRNPASISRLEDCPAPALSQHIAGLLQNSRNLRTDIFNLPRPRHFSGDQLRKLVAAGREALIDFYRSAVPAPGSAYRSAASYAPEDINGIVLSHPGVSEALFSQLGRSLRGWDDNERHCAAVFLGMVALDSEAYGTEIRQRALSLLLENRGKFMRPESRNMLDLLGYERKPKISDFAPWDTKYLPKDGLFGGVIGAIAGYPVALILQKVFGLDMAALFTATAAAIVGSTFGSALRVVNFLAGAVRLNKAKANPELQPGLTLERIDSGPLAEMLAATQEIPQLQAPPVDGFPASNLQGKIKV